MSLAPGTRLGAFEIVGPLGAGGMGEVYRARDTRLGREVALKLLPETFASDPDRLMRFEREAKTLASLNHPRIAQVYGFEEVPAIAGAGLGALRVLAMELVDGEDLAARLARGALPIDEALPIAAQIAEALEAAHEQGIIHRDLKPANIKIRPDGTVKVLDFGLAKLAAAAPTAGTAGDLLNSPTLASPMTMQGTILGTAAYMAPEQAKGRPVDKRADIWAFGVVLFEMLTGRTLFGGESAADVLGAVLRQPIDLATLPTGTPAGVVRLLRRCLARDPIERLHDIADARIEIRDHAMPDPQPHVAASASSHMSRIWLGAVVGAIVAGAAVSLWALLGSTPSPQARAAYHFTIPRPDGNGADGVPAVSPDGRYLVYSTSGRLLVRALGEVSPRPLDGTEEGQEPFWSPDSRSIAFFADEKLKRIALAGGPVETVTTVPRGWTVGSWSGNGTILIEVTENPDNEGWYVLSPGAATLKKIRGFATDRPISPDKAFPSFLPDGTHFLFTSPIGDKAMLQVGSIATDETRPLISVDTRALFASPGFVLYVRNGTLLAQPFDPVARAITGEPMTVADGLQYFTPTGESGFSVSQEGSLVLRRGEGRSQLRWFDRDGRAKDAVLGHDYYANLEISKDGRRLVTEVEDRRRSTNDLWVVDLERNVSTRLTWSPRSEMTPRWSPNGTQLVFSADWEGPPNLYLTDAAGGAPRVLVPFDRTQQFAGGWTSDGRQVVYATHSKYFARDLWVVDVATGDRRPIVATEFDESAPSVSPNGRWIAYVSDASGRSEIYLRDFAEGTWQARVSAAGGRSPKWRHDGRELFYYQPDGAIMAVPIDVGPAGLSRSSLPVRLFQIDARTFRSFDVASDGQRFLLNLADPDGLSPPDEIVIDWTRLLKR